MLSEDRIPGMQNNINILKIEKPRTNKTFISAIHYCKLENIMQVLILGRIILTVHSLVYCYASIILNL